MFKFNNDHIFTGYLKQLLASFHLPKCKVYTKEQQEHSINYLQNASEIEQEFKKLQVLRKALSNEKIELLASLEELNALQASLSLESPKTELSEEDLKQIYTDTLAELEKTIKQLAEVENRLFKSFPELNVLETVYQSQYDHYPNSFADDLPLKLVYPPKMRYIPYIKLH